MERPHTRSRGGPIDATEKERKTLEDFFGSMDQGFGGTFDQLGEYGEGLNVASTRE